MPSAIFSLLPVRRGSTVASTRIGCWLSDILDLPLYDDDQILKEGPLDNLFIINGSTLYCKYLPQIAQAVTEARDVFWVQNDYTLPPPAPISAAESPFRKAFADRKLVPHFWTTCQGAANRTPKSRWLNWNVLGYESDSPRIATLQSQTGLYYGAYREGRRASFEALYAMLPPWALRISSTSKKFREDYLIAPFRDDLYHNLAQFGFGIYAQDKKSQAGNHSPATRFYEMLSVGLPMFFLPDCVATLGTYGIDVSPFVLKPTTVDSLRENLHGIQAAQQRWRRDFKHELKLQVQEAYNGIS